MPTNTRPESTGITYEKLRPFWGMACHIRMRCVACPDTHNLMGHLQPGKLIGDVIVHGYTFSVEDIEDIWLPDPPAPPRRRAILKWPDLRSAGRRLLAPAGTGAVDWR
jgi:hypothetical protein